MTEDDVPPTVRLVVVGHDDHQRGCVVADRQVPPSPQKAAGYRFHMLWGTDHLPSYPDDGLQTTFQSTFPGVGAVRLAHLVVEPDSAYLNPDQGGASEQGAIEGVNTSSSRAAGMHYTPSIDMQTVISGEVWVELDDGVEVQLKAGESMIQQGAWHAWRNRGTEPAHVIAAVLGVEHRGFSDETGH
jgi:mannose-6-phosphate isomerase-like protein (cupin superfamily)